MKYLNQTEATNIDVELFTTYKFSVDQLMELAGLSCAHAIAKCFKLSNENQLRRILVCCGPGNNGGDGLVAARHLAIMGHKCDIYYPKRTDKELYRNLVTQCESFGELIRFIETSPTSSQLNNGDYRLIVDALFGFSFRPPVRDAFVPLMNALYDAEIPIASIDIPSGWHVENGPDTTENQRAILPELLISLTAPKLCAKYFTGKYHFLGGRFVPPSMQQKYELNLIDYPGTDTCVEIVKS